MHFKLECGDAHGRNFFYNNEEELFLGDTQIEKDSPYRIAMIDYASIIKTLDDIGDPAEDVGRFLGSLWNWGTDSPEKYAQVRSLQNHFFETYLETIKGSPIFTKKNHKNFEKIFKENVNFYQLRYYKPIFNSPSTRVNNEAKKTLLTSWMGENSHLEDAVAQEKMFARDSSGNRHWEAVNGNTDEYLPDRSEEFIESAPEGSEKSNLDLLWEQLHQMGRAALTSKTAIAAGTGGIGKSSLALEYAHEALENRAYNAIYWLPSSSELSLIKAYQSFLQEREIATQGKNDQEIIELFRREVSKLEKCLFVYDNVPPYYHDVPAPIFLQDKIPEGENAHIMMTTRCNEGWEEKWGKPITLDVFRPSDSIKYLLKVTGLEKNPENQQIAGELAEELQHLPLALAHAAHYIKLAGGARVSGATFKEYLEGFKEVSVKYFEEKKNSFTESHSKLTYEHLIARTLRMTDQYLSRSEKKHVAELAKRLMNYCAYLDSDSIAEELFPEYESNPRGVKKALQLLSSLSLIKNIQNQSLFSIHRLEQLVIQEELEEKKQNQEVLLPLVSALNTLFEKNIDTEEHIDKLENFFPHFAKLLEHSWRLKLSSEEVRMLDWINQILCSISSFLFVNKLEEGKNFSKKINKYFGGQQEFNKIADASGRESKALKMIPKMMQSLAKGPIEREDFARLLLQYVEKRHQALHPSSSFKFPIKNDNLLRWLEAVISSIVEKSHPVVLHTFYPYLKGPIKDVDIPQGLAQIAEKGPPLIQYVISLIYIIRFGNYEEGFSWCYKAADRGYAEAQHDCGSMCYKGQGVKKNYDEAVKWWTKASEQNFGWSQAALGGIYAKGKKVKQDYKKAVDLLTKAADQGFARAQGNLGVVYREEGNYPKAVECFKKAAEMGVVDAQYNLGVMCLEGKGVEQNYAQAAELFKTAADKGFAMAQHNLGVLYFVGKGVPQQSDGEAIKCFSKAASQGLKEAQFNLGQIYDKQQDYPKAVGAKRESW